MLYEFKSRVAGSVVMTDSVGAQVLSLLDRAGPKGIFTVEQLPAAIATLQAQAALHKAPPANDEDQSGDAVQQPAVSLAARLTPLIELMQRSLQGNKEVTWGV
jgi:hypothetical protein